MNSLVYHKALQRLSRGSVQVSRLSRSLNRIGQPPSTAAQLKGYATICRDQAKNGVRCFSTEGGAGSENNEDLSTMSSAELQLLAMKHARQANPFEAQVVLRQLEKVPDGPSVEELVHLRTSMIDSWIQYQTSKIQELKEAVARREPLREQKLKLKELSEAAESASEVLEAMDSPSIHHVAAVLAAWANVCEAAREAGLSNSDSVRGIPQRTQHIVGLQAEPTVELTNQVLKAWAYSGEHLRGTMAEQLFQEMKTPDGDSYRYIIRAWCWSKERRHAFTATGHFMRMVRLLELGQSDMEPTIEDCHVLFESWTSAEDKNAPSKVQTVLQIVEEAYRKDLTELRADEQCYRDALTTMARRVNVPEVGELVDQTLAEMKDRMIIPDTACYGAAILAWKHVATSRESEDREGAVQRTVGLLQEMTKAYHRTTAVTVKPTTENYNDVLEALTVSKVPKATTQAEMLLRGLEDSLGKSDASGEEIAGSTETAAAANIGPTAESYRYVLDVWCNSKKPNKMVQAKDVLKRMMDHIGLLKERSSEEAIVAAFSSFIKACGHTNVKEESLRAGVMATAISTLDHMRELGLQPDSSTFEALLEATDRILSKSNRDRQRVLDNVFQRACDEGYVNQNVLELFKASSSTYSYSQLVINPSREVDQVKAVPESWTRNVAGFSALTKEGRKVLPLSIEGKFTFTRAASEYKMRKLRRRRNQQMLQGGRA